jgi:hypothetical protein
MRQLTANETELLEKRRRGFHAFVQEIGPVLADFAVRLGLQNPETISTNPGAFLEDIDAFMKAQTVADEDRIWITARLAYFIGQILIHRLGGEWMVNENPISKYFLHYVIGHVPGVRNPNATIDPLVVVSTFLAQPPGRSLVDIVSEVQHEVSTYWDELGAS